MSEIQTWAFEGEYITFELIESKPKTGVYVIKTKDENQYRLGIVKFYPPWRQYSFFPAEDTVYEKTCMLEIVSFMTTLNQDLRSRKKLKDNYN